MAKQEIITVFAVIVFSIGTVLVVLSYEWFNKRADVVELIAKAPERGNWSPKIIHIKKGKKITLKIRNADVVTHGFYLPAFNLIISEIKAGEIKEVSFTPESKGNFTFYCSVWCSDYHMQMRGELIVE